MSSMVWLNGRLVSAGEARLSVFDRGFTLADGIFETLRARGSHIMWLADHLARLRNGAATLGIEVSFDDAAIGKGLIGLAAQAGQTESTLRLTLSRGPSERRGLWPQGDAVKPTMLATLSAWSPPPLRQRFVIAQTTCRNERSPLSRIKSLNYADNILARREAAAKGAEDALMLNTKDRLACATVGNVFLRIGGVWFTPPVEDGVLPGLARQRLIPLLPAHEQSIPRADLTQAEAGLVCNSLGISAIDRIDGCALAAINVEIWQQIYRD